MANIVKPFDHGDVISDPIVRSCILPSIFMSRRLQGHALRPMSQEVNVNVIHDDRKAK